MITAEDGKSIVSGEDNRQYDSQELVSLLAHELRQPLSTMESLACYLEIVLPPGEIKARMQVSKMQELLRQTNWILSDAVHFLHAANKHPVLMDWNETIMEIVSEGGAAPGETIEFVLDDSIPPIPFDLDQARHLAIGLYIFLRKLSRGKGSVQVSSKLQPDFVELEFSCVASDANPKSWDSLFDPFNRYAPAGSGLAMASALQIVHRHGGAMEVHTRPADLLAIAVRFPIQPPSQPAISSQI